MNFIFLQPYFLLLFFLPFLYFFIKKDNAEEVFFPYLDDLKKINAHKNNSKKYNISKLLYFLIIWISLVISLADPNLVNKHKTVSTSGYDLILAVDVSASMSALDFSTKKKITNKIRYK